MVYLILVRFSIIEMLLVGMDDILSEYNFTYVACDYCPGEYWPDNKSGQHTLFIYSTQQPLTAVLEKLGKLVKGTVYI